MTALAAASARVAAPARVSNRRAVVARASSAPPSSSAASSAIASRRSLVAGTAALVASNAALVRAAFADGDEEVKAAVLRFNRFDLYTKVRLTSTCSLATHFAIQI